MNYKQFLSRSDRGCMIIVHRGIWAAVPENSLLAIECAIAEGYDAVEIDVRKTRDGAFVLMHDDTTERMTGHAGSIETMSLSELRALRLRNRDGGLENEVTHEIIPTLEEVFDLTRGRTFIHLDIKDRTLIPEFLRLSRSAGVAGEVDVWSPLRDQADYGWLTQTVLPTEAAFIAKTRLNVENADEQLELVLKLKPDICEIYFDDIAQVKGVRSRFDDAGIALWVNTLDSVSSAGLTDTRALEDPAAVWGVLLDAGISAIQTDEAAALRAFLRR